MSVEDSSRNSIVVLLIIGSLILFSGLAIILIKPTIENPISCNDEDVDICNMETMEKYASRGSGTNGDPYIIENLVFDSGILRFYETRQNLIYALNFLRFWE